MTSPPWLSTAVDLSDSPRLPSQEPVVQALEQLRRQQQLILNAVGEGVYGLDLAGNVTFVNPAAAAMIDWPVEELVGKSMHKVLHHSHSDGSVYPREACAIYAAFQDGSTRRVTDEVFWRKDGTSFPVEYISTPMRDEAGQLVGASRFQCSQCPHRRLYHLPGRNLCLGGFHAIFGPQHRKNSPQNRQRLGSTTFYWFEQYTWCSLSLWTRIQR